MKDIQIDRVTLPYRGSNSVGGYGVFESTEFGCNEAYYGECSINPCLNNGECMEVASGVLCSCKGIQLFISNYPKNLLVIILLLCFQKLSIGSCLDFSY